MASEGYWGVLLVPHERGHPVPPPPARDHARHPEAAGPRMRRATWEGRRRWPRCRQTRPRWSWGPKTVLKLRTRYVLYWFPTIIAGTVPIKNIIRYDFVYKGSANNFNLISNCYYWKDKNDVAFVLRLVERYYWEGTAFSRTQHAKIEQNFNEMKCSNETSTDGSRYQKQKF